MGEKKSKSAYIKWLPVCILLLAVYQDEIESWGYQVLVLTDAAGGKFCFCYGFDGYTSVVSYTAMVERTSGEYEEALKTVRLELAYIFYFDLENC